MDDIFIESKWRPCGEEGEALVLTGRLRLDLIEMGLLDRWEWRDAKLAVRLPYLCMWKRGKQVLTIRADGQYLLTGTLTREADRDALKDEIVEWLNAHEGVVR